MTRLGTTVVLAVVALAASPAAARAGTVTPSGFQAGAGETNVLTVSFDGTEHVISDAGAPLLVAPGCRLDPPESATARCSLGDGFGVWLGDGDDQATVATEPQTHPLIVGEAGDDTITLLATGGVAVGEEGDDVLIGGPNPDRLIGEAGRDTILARGGGTDLLDCGAGTDRIEIDGQDWGGSELGDPWDDGACEGGELTRPVLDGLTGVSLRPGTRRIKIPLECSKRFCSGRVRFVSVETLEGVAYRLRAPRWARARFPGGRRRGWARVTLSRRDHRALLKISGDASDATMLVELRDRVGHVQRSIGTFLI
jgi:hypothetical protein